MFSDKMVNSIVPHYITFQHPVLGQWYQMVPDGVHTQGRSSISKIVMAMGF